MSEKYHKKVTELQNESVSDKADTASSVFIVKRDVSYMLPSKLSKSSVIWLFNATCLLTSMGLHTSENEIWLLQFAEAFLLQRR